MVGPTVRGRQSLYVAWVHTPNRVLDEGPVLSTQRHRHRVWAARMNHVYKQLAASCSSDSTARVWFGGGCTQRIRFHAFLHRYRRSANECEVVSYEDFEESVLGTEANITVGNALRRTYKRRCRMEP